MATLCKLTKNKCSFKVHFRYKGNFWRLKSVKFSTTTYSKHILSMTFLSLKIVLIFHASKNSRRRLKHQQISLQTKERLIVSLAWSTEPVTLAMLVQEKKKCSHPSSLDVYLGRGCFLQAKRRVSFTITYIVLCHRCRMAVILMSYDICFVYELRYMWRWKSIA